MNFKLLRKGVEEKKKKTGKVGRKRRYAGKEEEREKKRNNYFLGSVFRWSLAGSPLKHLHITCYDLRG